MDNKDNRRLKHCRVKRINDSTNWMIEVQLNQLHNNRIHWSFQILEGHLSIKEVQMFKHQDQTIEVSINKNSSSDTK